MGVLEFFNGYPTKQFSGVKKPDLIIKNLDLGLNPILEIIP
jgi:hypothetical protein